MRWLAYYYLRLTGWSFAGRLPDAPGFVVIGAPHTSNWDFLAFLAASHHFRFRPRYIGKASLFRPPFGRLMTRLGGIPVDRTSPQGLVDQVVGAMRSAPNSILVIAPEGTRSASGWRSGFYHIAAGAGVPIVCAAVDGERKVIEIAGSLMPSGDVSADFGRIAERGTHGELLVLAGTYARMHADWMAGTR